MPKDPSDMKPKALRKELAEVFGHDKSFLKGQPVERLTKMLTVDRKSAALADEARTELIEEFGYDPDTTNQQTDDEVLRQRRLEHAGRKAGATQPEPKPEPKKRKRKKAEPVDDTGFGEGVVIDTSKPAPKKRKAKAKPVSQAEALDIEMGVDEDIDLDAEIAELIANQPEPAPSIFLGLPGVYDYRMDGHAGVGPSGAERWMSCTASLQASREFLETLTPNQLIEFAKANIAARQGTTAHTAAESKANLMLGRIDDNEHEHNLLELTNLPETEAESYDDEMSEYIEEYIDMLGQLVQERGEENVLIEHRVLAPVALTGKHDDEVYEVPGSADAVGLPIEGIPDLVVGDLKYGNGYDVDVEKNPQIRIYALGVLASLCDDEGNLTVDIETITYHIIQPRLGGIKTWSEPIEDLLQWVDEALAPALTAALYGVDEGAEFAPSDDACQWCPARGACPALAQARTEAATELFTTITEHEFEHGSGEFPETGTLPSETLGSLLAQIDGLVDLRKDLKSEVQRRLHRGEEVPGYHLVSYTPKREWDEDAVEELADLQDVWSTSLVTPTQALKLVEKDDELKAKVAEHVIAPDKRPVAAPVTDRRKKWEGKPPEQMFEIEE